MNIDEFFDELAEHARTHNYYLSALSVVVSADSEGVDVGSIIWVGRKHLIPRGWTRYLTTSGGSVYKPPEEGK